MTCYVERHWPGCTMVCLGSGPSLTPEDVAFARGRARVLAIKNTYTLAPWADVLYGCESNWWDWVKGAPDFVGLKYAMEPEAHRKWGIPCLENTGEEGLELQPHGLKTGRNSGYQAINLAVHLGATRIILLGYDMQRGPAPQGLAHYFGNHPWERGSPFPIFLHLFETLRAPLAAIGVEVLNCTRRTALTTFPLVPLESVFAAQAAVA